MHTARMQVKASYDAREYQRREIFGKSLELGVGPRVRVRRLEESPDWEGRRPRWWFSQILR
jgi:hypothetical protein